MTKLAEYQLRRAQQAGFHTIAEWQAHCQAEHDRMRARVDWRYRERDELRAVVGRGCVARGNEFVTSQGARQ